MININLHSPRHASTFYFQCGVSRYKIVAFLNYCFSRAVKDLETHNSHSIQPNVTWISPTLYTLWHECSLGDIVNPSQLSEPRHRGPNLITSSLLQPFAAEPGTFCLLRLCSRSQLPNNTWRRFDHNAKSLIQSSELTYSGCSPAHGCAHKTHWNQQVLGVCNLQQDCHQWPQSSVKFKAIWVHIMIWQGGSALSIFWWQAASPLLSSYVFCCQRDRFRNVIFKKKNEMLFRVVIHLFEDRIPLTWMTVLI